MKKIIFFFLLTYSFFYVNAQQSDFTSIGRGVSTTFATDYHTVGVNPANLGFKTKYEGKHVTFGLLETGASAYSGALGKTDFRNSLTNYGKKFTYEEKLNAASQFAGTNLALNLDMNWFGISYQHDKVGGFAFNIRENVRWFSNFNQNMSDIMFLGYKASYFNKLILNNNSIVNNDPSQYAAYEASGGIKSGYNSNGPLLFSQLFNGSRMSMTAYREYNLSYGKEVKINDNFSVAGGLGLKYLQGYGIMDIQVKDGKLTSYGAFSPAFGIDFGNATKSNPSADTTSKGYKPVGQGFGADIGFNLLYKEKTKIGFAFTNIGSITWNGNVYTAQDQNLDTLSSGGFDSYNIFVEAGKVASNGFFKWEGKKKMTTQLPTMFRFGISHQLTERVEIGIDIIAPLNKQPGGIQKTYGAIGGDFRVLKFLRLSGGVGYGGNYDNRINIPLGITFIAGERGTWEFGFASRDAVTYFRQKGPALSFAFGFLRFRV